MIFMTTCLMCVCVTTQKSQLVHTIVLHVHTQLITCTSSKWIPVG